MPFMELAPIPIQSGRNARPLCARGQMRVRVKFLGLLVQAEPEVALWERRPEGGNSVFRLISRVIGRLVAARP